MKKSLLELDSQADALLILQRPNLQKVRAEADQDASDDDESVKTRMGTPRTQDSNSTRSPITLEEITSLQPYLDNGDSNQIEFRISAKHLAIASPVFRGMIQGKFQESQPNRDGLLEIKASDWNAHALLILLDIIHGHHREVPGRLDLETIAQIGLLVDYYDCLEITEIFFDRWSTHIPRWIANYRRSLSGMRLPTPADFGENETLLLFIAWVFQGSSTFWTLTMSAVNNANGFIKTELPIPNQVLKRIDEKRVELLDRIFSRLYKLQEDLVVGRVGCSLECSCRLLGYLMKQMREHDLPMIKPEKPFSGYSVTFVIAILRRIKTPIWRNNKNIDNCKLEKSLSLEPERGGLYIEEDEWDSFAPGLKLEDFQ
ncbi:hypothetical protein F53441_5379 [Fusarium austroafricanum]|uniref:BTB domain-containing protein n=1 Tax=Fusarium austroafricanum TaxID=2364996 RepID=A0A8H4KKC2_9HYPO|nr:hypothetical protein F53441_5379 [Fusarium austroafricanum]